MGSEEEEFPQTTLMQGRFDFYLVQCGGGGIVGKFEPQYICVSKLCVDLKVSHYNIL